MAAPVYAATGSRWKAMGIAIASVRLPYLLVLQDIICVCSQGCHSALVATKAACPVGALLLTLANMRGGPCYAIIAVAIIAHTLLVYCPGGQSRQGVIRLDPACTCAANGRHPDILVQQLMTWSADTSIAGRAAGPVGAAGRADCAALCAPAADAPAPPPHAGVCGRHHGQRLLACLTTISYSSLSRCMVSMSYGQLTRLG